MKNITAKQLRTVTILIRYFIKKTQAVVLYVENDKGVRYYCTLNENGTHSCTCPATKECYHLKAVVKAEEVRKAKWIAYRRELARKLAAQFMTTQIVEQLAKMPDREIIPVRQVFDFVPSAKSVKVAKVIEQAVEAKVPTTDLSKKGNLYTGRAFSLMR